MLQAEDCKLKDFKGDYSYFLEQVRWYADRQSGRKVDCREEVLNSFVVAACALTVQIKARWMVQKNVVQLANGVLALAD